jgi:predicted RNase H-like HicB family nuclease
MIDLQRMPVEQRELHVDVHHEDGAYWAQVRELPGCFASGATVAELVEAIEEAVALYLAPPEAEGPASLAVEVAGFNLSLESDRPLQPA